MYFNYINPGNYHSFCKWLCSASLWISSKCLLYECVGSSYFTMQV